jgi:UDP-N-acetylmuramyl pentapeptide synthase
MDNQACTIAIGFIAHPVTNSNRIGNGQLFFTEPSPDFAGNDFITILNCMPAACCFYDNTVVQDQRRMITFEVLKYALIRIFI